MSNDAVGTVKKQNPDFTSRPNRHTRPFILQPTSADTKSTTTQTTSLATPQSLFNNPDSFQSHHGLLRRQLRGDLPGRAGGGASAGAEEEAAQEAEAAEEAQEAEAEATAEAEGDSEDGKSIERALKSSESERLLHPSMVDHNWLASVRTPDLVEFLLRSNNALLEL
ncbi:uncharacterized protein MYCGRDRAFT_91525 [Zymoseptoria tritici IPO323]|uniref:Uncharacterized protein n=1 Tax=Zymoseptoria tritici (strain CBS 115943 / IPO323) TaxID=336722 RepID=F9X5M2_ZYMTI|nr:uncharacterized protein MYCGRDRAFT_91525 [Zymoseptoria tritici IPO323]EGP88708.1 hypothetical protein MYCGRDRAFT_91525 [Zymoseptoria tritici IPO323]